MAEAAGGPVHQFGNIALGSRGASPQGTLKIEGGSLNWKKTGGGKSLSIGEKDIKELAWARSGKEFQLFIKKADGTHVGLLGFRERDLEALKENLPVDVEERSFATSGRNWGSIEIVDSSLAFRVGDKPAFELALNEVTQASLQGKNEVAIEFQADDTAAGGREDALTEMSFFVPPTSDTFVAEEDKTSARVFLDRVTEKAEIDTAGDESVLSMPDIAAVVPRGRYQVELHLTYLKLIGQSQDFKIRYSSIMRIFKLPKTNQPQTLVVLTLDPPIRKGQTFYQHVLFQFHNDDLEEVMLNMSDDALEKKNAQTGGKLERSFQGPTHEVFANVVRGLAGVKISQPVSYKNHSGEGQCVRCSYKSDDGYLFPLEKSLFYVQKPPLLIMFDDIRAIEFQRQTLNQYSSAAKTFDIVVKTKGDVQYLFRSIQKQEWQNLFTFIQEHNLRIENLKEVQQGMGGRGAEKRSVAPAAGLEAGGEDDESDEDDEDFVGSEGEADDDDDDDSDVSEGSAASSDDDDESDASDESEDEPKKKKSKK